MEVFGTAPLQPPNGQVGAGAGAGIDVNPVTDTTYVTYPGVLTGAVYVLDSSLQQVAAIRVGSVPIGVAVNATTNSRRQASLLGRAPPGEGHRDRPA